LALAGVSRVFVVNAGSSSLKLSILDEEDRVVDTGSDLDTMLGRAQAVGAVGHRVVHGGTQFRGPAVIDDSVLDAIRGLCDLAPLHQPAAIAGIEAVRSALPGVVNVACFDTAFHTTIPDAAATYALPREWRARWPLRRFGFHGLSHAYAAGRVGNGRVVTCHLGAGASLCAVRDGVSVDTTMGFTPLEGLVMATRSGTIDPGLVTWLARDARVPIDELDDALSHKSGLLGLAGTGDMRDLLARDDDDARLAFDVYVHRLRQEIAAMVASLGGLDTIVFTGGVGEHAGVVRAAAADGLAYLGVAIDAAANEAAHADADITAAGAAVRTLVITAREDVEIASQVRNTIARL